MALIFKESQEVDAIDFYKINKKATEFRGMTFKPKTHLINVIYDVESEDMAAISQVTKLSRDEIVRLHSLPLYDVHFIGFLPGFIYLGGMDQRLIVPRKQKPNKEVPKGSVAIGGSQTGIYPQSSPGGWFKVGATNHILFDPSGNPPVQIKPGDFVRFIQQKTAND